MSGSEWIGLAAVVVFAVMLVDSFKYADRLLIRIQVIEQSAPALP